MRICLLCSVIPHVPEAVTIFQRYPSICLAINTSFVSHIIRLLSGNVTITISTPFFPHSPWLSFGSHASPPQAKITWHFIRDKCDSKAAQHCLSARLKAWSLGTSAFVNPIFQSIAQDHLIVPCAEVCRSKTSL
jgi:hypothetical protein